MKMLNRNAVRPFLMIAALLAFGLTMGCGEYEELETPSSCSEETGTCEAHVFLEIDEFEFLRQQGDVLILDSRSEEDHSAGHIPGSYPGNWRAFVNPDRNGILWEDEEKLEDAARELGIQKDQTVVIYGAGDGSGGDSPAGRLLWTLEYLGHDDVLLVNGGLENWIDANYDGLQAGSSTATRSEFSIDVQPQRRATAGEVEAAIDDESLRLVDTRRVTEWEGEELRNNPEGGFIPEAVHYHWEDVFDENGLLRSPEEIRAELEALDITDDTLIIPYCQSGVRSGFFYAVLKWLGHEDPKNYDGSWWEWSREYADQIGSQE